MSGNFTLFDGLLVLLSTGIAVAMLRPRVRDAPFWRATVTPLASIIGSGFLVVVPLLAGIAGPLSIVAIGAIIALSFWLGAAVRYNILHDGRTPEPGSGRIVTVLERFSDLALAAAYVISITFYVRLMCSFLLTGVHTHSDFNANVLATSVLAFIGIYGWRRGLLGLERLEAYSVTIKLAIIAALLVGLAWHDIGHGDDLSRLPMPDTSLWDTVCQLAGMVLIVQGFETSKYLDAQYDAPLRARSMRLAQWVAGVIYLAFVVLAMPLMAPLAHQSPDETAIIHLSASITLVLPVMLVVAAAMSQFSAAIADTIGAGGVVENEVRGRISCQWCYPMITALAIVLVWTANIFEVIALASRAFAFYYMLQALLAARLASRRAEQARHAWVTAGFLALALAMLFVVIFAEPVAA